MRNDLPPPQPPAPECWQCGAPNPTCTDGVNDICIGCRRALKDEYAAEQAASRKGFNQ